MKHTLLTLMFALAIMTFSNAQKIESKKVFGGYQYTQSGNKMSMGDLSNTMKSNPESLKLINKAKSNNLLASIIGGVGGFMIGYPIGTAIGGGEANWTLAGIGAGLIVIGIPISSSANKNTKKAVDLYNSTLNSISNVEFKPEIIFLAKGNGIGLSIIF